MQNVSSNAHRKYEDSFGHDHKKLCKGTVDNVKYITFHICMLHYEQKHFLILSYAYLSAFLLAQDTLTNINRWILLMFQQSA